ncbi:hypothetical protein [Rhodoferax ferrireducens]|nr:hypothetical protein [Rhodoferax ferrireducens]
MPLRPKRCSAQSRRWGSTLSMRPASQLHLQAGVALAQMTQLTAK